MEAEARLFEPGDAEGLRRLLEEAFGPAGAGQASSRLEGGRIWLGWPGDGGRGAPAAFCRVVPDRETRARGLLCLDALFVSAASRRKGLGRALLRVLQEAARREGLGGIWAYFPLRLPAGFLAATGGRRLRSLRLFRLGELERIPFPRIPPGCRLRPLTLPGDLAPAAELYNAVFARMWNFRLHTPEDIADWFEGADTAAENCLVIETQSEPAAMLGMVVVAVDPSRLQARDRTAYVPDIGVTPAYRGKGWGEILIAAAAARARELGLTAIELIADQEDAAVCAFYRRMGFEEGGTLHVYEWGS